MIVKLGQLIEFLDQRLPGGNIAQIVYIIILFLVVFVVIWLIREFTCWLFKINKIEQTLKEIQNTLKTQKK